MLRIRGIGFDEGKCCFINLINICIFFFCLKSLRRKIFPLLRFQVEFTNFPGFSSFTGGSTSTTATATATTKNLIFINIFFSQQLKGGKQTIFRKMEKSEVESKARQKSDSVRIGTSFPTILCQNV